MAPAWKLGDVRGQSLTGVTAEGGRRRRREQPPGKAGVAGAGKRPPGRGERCGRRKETRGRRAAPAQRRDPREGVSGAGRPEARTARSMSPTTQRPERSAKRQEQAAPFSFTVAGALAVPFAVKPTVTEAPAASEPE